MPTEEEVYPLFEVAGWCGADDGAVISRWFGCSGLILSWYNEDFFTGQSFTEAGANGEFLIFFRFNILLFKPEILSF